MARHKTRKIELFDKLDNCFYGDDENLQNILRNSGDLIIEAGCGDGRFAVWLAREYPESLVIGVDLKVNRLAQGGRSAAEQNLANVIFVKSQIQRLEELIPANKVSQVWITFPDPFPKSKHHKRRLTKPAFLRLYAKWLTESGRVQLKTDDMAFFVDSLVSLEAGRWAVEELSTDLHGDFPDRFWRTTFEDEFVSNGLPINFLSATPPSG